MSYRWKELLMQWGMKKYIEDFENNGWNDSEYWIELTDEELNGIKMGRLHMNKFRVEIGERNDVTYKIWNSLQPDERKTIKELYQLTSKFDDSTMVEVIAPRLKLMDHLKLGTKKTLNDGIQDYINQETQQTLSLQKVNVDVKNKKGINDVLLSNQMKEHAMSDAVLLGGYGGYFSFIGAVAAEEAGMLVAGSALGPVGIAIAGAGVIGFSIYKLMKSDPECIKKAKSWFHINKKDEEMDINELIKLLKQKMKGFFMMEHSDKGGKDELVLQTQQHFKLLVAYYNPKFENEQDLSKYMKSLKL